MTGGGPTKLSSAKAHAASAIDRLLRFFWKVEDPAAGGPVRHASLHLTSSWVYLALVIALVADTMVALLVGGLAPWIVIHLIALVSIWVFWRDRRRSRTRQPRGRHTRGGGTMK